MKTSELDAIVNAWIARQEATEGSRQYDDNEWTVSIVAGSNSPDFLWQFIMKTFRRTDHEEVLGMLAAGPLENLLSYRGGDYIERIEHLASEDERFKQLLHGVWRLAMTDDVWTRLQAARGPRPATDS